MDGLPQLTCRHCATVFLCPKKQKYRVNKVLYCSVACRAKGHWTVPGRREAASRLTRMKMLTPGSRLRTAILKRMQSSRNPSKNPLISQKIASKLRGRPAPHLNGGNGTGLTVPQALLLERLGQGWYAEFSVRHKAGRSVWPAGLRFDLAHPQLRLAVECDGMSHKSRSVQLRDEKKRRLAKEVNWRILRFTNLEILNSTETVLQEIQRQCSLSPQFPDSSKKSST